MKRREPTARQKKNDQIAGFNLFMAANIAILALVPGVHDPSRAGPIEQMLPWLVNGGLLLVMFIFRPHMALGYIACPFILGLAVVAAGVYLALSCAASVATAVLLGPAAIFVFLVLVVAGIYFGGRIFLGRIDKWWEEVRIEEYHSSVRRRMDSDFNLLKKFKSGEIEIGDDGEIRPARRSSRDK